MRKSSLMAWGLLAPTLIVLGFVGLLPFFYVLYVGFFDWDIFAKASGLVWTGVDNYRELLFDADFLSSLGRSLTFMAYVCTTEITLGMILAHLLLNEFRGRSFFRAIHALPLTVAPIAIGAVWKLMTNPGLGPLPYYLRKIGIDYNIGIPGPQAFATTVIMDVWHWTPFVTLTFLAGLSAMPREPVEAAMVDGANRWQIFRHVTLPMIQPVVLTTLFIRIMDALRIVDEVYMLTGGGPGTHTHYIGIYVWRVVFPKVSYGYGSAMSVLLLYFTIVLCWLLVSAITQVRRGAGT